MTDDVNRPSNAANPPVSESPIIKSRAERDSEFQHAGHTYQCRIDKTTLLTPIKAHYGAPYRCPVCNSWMKHLFTYWYKEPIKGHNFTRVVRK